jgi:hypothetical protein
VIGADTIGFVIPAAAAEKERHFKMNSSTIKHPIQPKSVFLGYLISTPSWIIAIAIVTSHRLKSRGLWFDSLHGK